jgi:hypothetical protein
MTDDQLAAFAATCTASSQRVIDYARWLFTQTDNVTALKLLRIERDLSNAMQRDMFGYVAKIYYAMHDERTRE